MKEINRASNASATEDEIILAQEIGEALKDLQISPLATRLTCKMIVSAKVLEVIMQHNRQVAVLPLDELRTAQFNLYEEIQAKENNGDVFTYSK